MLAKIRFEDDVYFDTRITVNSLMKKVILCCYVLAHKNSWTTFTVVGSSLLSIGELQNVDAGMPSHLKNEFQRRTNLCVIYAPFHALETSCARAITHCRPVSHHRPDAIHTIRCCAHSTHRIHVCSAAIDKSVKYLPGARKHTRRHSTVRNSAILATHSLFSVFYKRIARAYVLRMVAGGEPPCYLPVVLCGRRCVGNRNIISCEAE